MWNTQYLMCFANLAKHFKHCFQINISIKNSKGYHNFKNVSDYLYLWAKSKLMFTLWLHKTKCSLSTWVTVATLAYLTEDWFNVVVFFFYCFVFFWMKLILLDDIQLNGSLSTTVWNTCFKKAAKKCEKKKKNLNKNTFKQFNFWTICEEFLQRQFIRGLLIFEFFLLL